MTDVPLAQDFWDNESRVVVHKLEDVGVANECAKQLDDVARRQGLALAGKVAGAGAGVEINDDGGRLNVGGSVAKHGGGCSNEEGYRSLQKVNKLGG